MNFPCTTDFQPAGRAQSGRYEIPPRELTGFRSPLKRRIYQSVARNGLPRGIGKDILSFFLGTSAEGRRKRHHHATFSAKLCVTQQTLRFNKGSL